MHIRYFTTEGEEISYSIDDERGLTMNDIDNLALMYYEKTSRVPEKVFISAGEYSKLMKTLASRYLYPSAQLKSMKTVSFMTSLGEADTVVVKNAYTPVLVGTQVEYDDNDITKLFQDIVIDGKSPIRG